MAKLKSKGNLWIINYCILEIKADNEPSVSLPVYFKFVQKWKYVLRKKQNKTKAPPQKNKQTKKQKEKDKKRKFPPARVEPGTIDV